MKKMNKSLLYLGILLCLMTAAGLFLITNVLNPDPTMVAVALVEIEPGTFLGDLGNGTLDLVPVTGDDEILMNYLTLDSYNALVADGGIVIEHVSTGEMVPLSVIMSAQNPASSKYTDLVLNDPNMVAISVDASKAPKGVRDGDWVDVIVTINSVSDPQSTSNEQIQGYMYSPEENVKIIQYDSEGNIIGEDADAGEDQNLEEDEEEEVVKEEDTYIVPIAKTIVNNAYVLNVIRESRDQSNVDGSVSTVYGNITDFVLVVPRESVEYIMMAEAAGKLNFALLSPLAAEKEGTTIGATLKDLLEDFYADRDVLVPEPTPAEVSMPVDSQEEIEQPIEEPTPTPEVLPGS